MANNFTERENYILSNSVNIGWFLEAIDKNNPLHPEEGAAHTESYELDGQNILVPRVRIKDGKAILNKENALEEALEKGDYIVVPEGEDPDQYSKDLSKLIGKFRGFNKGGLSAQTEKAIGPQSELERQRSRNIAEQMSTLSREEEKTVHPLETVPFFQRPMDASTNDPLVGEDDAGNLIYRTMLGNTYTVKLNPDQRTTRAKIQEDVLPKVKDWLQNPKAPSQDQIVQMGKAIAESVYDLISIPGDLATEKRSASDVTLGDVYDTTGMAAVGSLPFKVPENALRTFGGKGARDLDIGAFAQARKLMKDGVQRINPNNPDQFYNLNKKVWNETGWYIDPSDNQWRFEIDDSKSKVILNNLPVTYKEIQDSGGEFKLSDVFKHEDLYKQYPHLKDIIIRFYNPSLAKNTTEQRADVAGYMDSPGNLLAINTSKNTVEEIRETLLHEIQHSIQNYEGFTPGSSSESIDPNVLAKGRDKVLNQIQDLSSDNSGIKVNNTQLLGEVSKLVPIEDFFPAELSKRYFYYGNTTDEIRKDLLDRRTNYLSTIVDKHPNADDFIGSETASKVLANIDKLRDNIFKQAAFEFSFPKLATEFYMGAGGEIESRLVEYSQNMTEWQRKNAPPGGSGVFNKKSGNYERIEGFPLDRVKDLLEIEGRYDKPVFRGKEGVDTTAKTRRAIPTENIGSSDIYLDIPKSDFKLQKDSEGKVIPTKKGKHSLPGVDKLKSLFKDEESVLNILNLKRGDTFTLNGKEYKFQRIGTMQLGKNELDRNQFILRPEEGSNYFDIVTVNAEDSLGRPNYISLSKFLDDPEKYIGKSIPEQTTSVFGKIKSKLSLAPNTSESLNFNLQDFGYRTDNPATKGYDNGEEWLKNKQKTAEDKAKKYSGDSATGKLLSGAITGYMGQDFKRPLFLNTEMLSKLKGANSEKRYAGESRYDALRKRVDERGFDPEQKYDSEDNSGNAIVIGVNHKGEAFIIEGNTRVAVAKDLNVPSIRAEVKYYNGAEEVDGPYSPQNILQYAENPKDFNKGGTVMNRQMEMAFMQEGGLKDDGTRQDPVSGNEVPSGSMASEVRDDIPAQLSEGEYVVPADVVRYLGVKHFEDLRNKAKSGLQKMEADGRIGGEPVPVGGPKANSSLQPPVPYAPPMAPQMAMGGDLTPEEMQEINSIMMASGGMVSGAAAGSFYSPPSGMTVEQAITTPTRYTGGFSWEKPQPTAPVKTPVTETPATCAARGMVYNPETKMCEMPISTPAADRGSKDSPDIPTPDPNAWMEKYDYENVDNLLEQSSDALDPKTGIGGFFEKVFGGGVLGAFAKGANAAQIAANINILSSIPSESLTPEQQTQLAGLKEKYKSYVKSNNLDIFGNELINGDQLAIDIITNPKNRGKGLFLTADSVDPFGKRIFKGGEKDPKFIKVMEEVASPGYKYDPDTGSYKPERDKDDDGRSFLAPDVSLRPKPRPKPSGGNNEEPKLEPKTPEPKAPDYTKPSQDPYAEPDRPKPGFSGADWSSGPLNKGGLMRKKKK